MNIKFLKANNGDSILISFHDSEEVKRNILIDGGMPQTYYNSGQNNNGDLYYTIEDIKTRGESIDLLVLTHIDEDHIGGILKWIEFDEEAHQIIKKVCFIKVQFIVVCLAFILLKSLHQALDPKIFSHIFL